jgi:preprotein translocase subunit YajC
MARQGGITEKVAGFLTQRKNWIFILAVGLIIILLPFLLSRSPGRATPDISADQIKIQKGDQIVIISEDGTVEYISSDGIYYDSWDSQTVSTFFSAMRTLAKQNLDKSPPKDTTNGYWISLFIDGEFVKVFVEGTSEEIEEILNELSEGLLEEILSELFDEFFEEEGPSPTPINFFASPTTSLFPTSTPTPVPGQFNPMSSGSIEDDCREWLAQGLGSTVIFHTVCIESPSPTP